jgi:uncharacterized protein YdaU (DUF1376 family)
MSRRPWYKRYPADFIGGTMHLSLEEKGAYSIVLDLMYGTGGPIEDDAQRIARVAGCSTKRWNIIRSRLITLGKLHALDGKLSNQRAENQMKTEDKERENLSENGAKGGQKTAQNRAPPNENKDIGEKGLTPPEQQAQKLRYSEAQNAEAKGSAKEEGTARAVVIGQKVTDIMGVTNDPRWLGNWSMVQGWLADGFDAELDILPTVTATVEKLRRLGRSMPKTLNYFTPIIRENHRIRQGSGVSPVATAGREFVEVKAGSKAFNAWLRFWESQGRKTGWLKNQRSITVPTEYPQAVDTRETENEAA